LCTPAAAALRLGVHETTVRRWWKTGRLTPLTPRHAPGEDGPTLLSCAEVDRLAEAMRVLKGNG
jgi:DNA-binding transcriptional regulator YdaS (Cro superfamily)